MHIGIIVVGFKIIIVLALQIWRALVHGISKMLQYFFLQIFANIFFHHVCSYNYKYQKRVYVVIRSSCVSFRRQLCFFSYVYFYLDNIFSFSKFWFWSPEIVNQEFLFLKLFPGFFSFSRQIAGGSS